MKCPHKNKVCEYWNDYCGCDDYTNKKCKKAVKSMKAKRVKAFAIVNTFNRGFPIINKTTSGRYWISDSKKGLKYLCGLGEKVKPCYITLCDKGGKR